MSNYWNGDERRWYLRAPTSTPSITVSEPSDEQKKATEEKVKQGARVVPFGFARVIAPAPVERDPIVWEGDDG